MIIAYIFSILGEGIYSLRKPLSWDNYQHPQRGVWLILPCSCCSCQLNYMVPICGVCSEPSPHARGHPGYHSPLH